MKKNSFAHYSIVPLFSDLYSIPQWSFLVQDDREQNAGASVCLSTRNCFHANTKPRSSTATVFFAKRVGALRVCRLLWHFLRSFRTSAERGCRFFKCFSFANYLFRITGWYLYKKPSKCFEVNWFWYEKWHRMKVDLKKPSSVYNVHPWVRNFVYEIRW